MELSACGGLDPGLHAKVLIPGDAFKEGVHKTNNDRGGHQLGPKARAFRNTARNDGGNGSRKSQQKEELDQVIAVPGGNFKVMIFWYNTR